MENYKQIHLQKLSTAAAADRYLLACNGRYYEAGAGVAELLACLQTHATEAEAVAAYVEQKQGRVSAAQVEAFIGEQLQPMLSEEAQPPKRTFLYERELFSAKMVDEFSNRFHFLFNGVWMALLMTCVVAADVWFFCTTDDLLVFNNAANAYTVVGLLVFMVVSSLFHELGHAAACKRFGIRHGGIGFGLYLNFPVLYTDVTEVWKLGRRQRCVVNLAGVYFQLYFLAVLLALFFATGNDIVRYLILTLNLGFVMTLNPFFKFDGYWLASDILGVPNLRARSKEVIAYFFRKWRGKPVGEKPYLLQVKRASRYGLLVYSVVVNVFMAYYFCYILPKFLVSFVQSFPEEVSQLVMYLSNGMTPSFALLRNIGMQLVLLALVGMMVYKLIYKLRIKN